MFILDIEALCCEFDESDVNAVGMITIPDVHVFQRRMVMYRKFLCAQCK